jgi:hypothetical protein
MLPKRELPKRELPKRELPKRELPKRECSTAKKKPGISRLEGSMND